MIYLFALACDVFAVVQVRGSDWFAKFLETYSDEEKYPYGPPSQISREYIFKYYSENPIQYFLRDRLHYDVNIGFFSIVLGFSLQFILAFIPSAPCSC